MCRSRDVGLRTAVTQESLRNSVSCLGCGGQICCWTQRAWAREGKQRDSQGTDVYVGDDDGCKEQMKIHSAGG